MPVLTGQERPLGELLTPRQKFLLLNSLMLTMFISALDGSIVATATPHILADLGGFNLLSWVFTIYLLASTVVVPLVGKLSDMYGRKPFILAGIAVFVAASAACGAAPSMLALIVARAVQGIGGGILFGCIFATLGDLFTPLERAKYMGYFIGAFTLASLAGPTVGGFLTDGPGWRWCFYINLPVGIVATAFVWRNLPYSRRGGSLRRIDFAGAALLSSSTICILLGLVWANEEFGWGSAETIGLFIAGAVLLVAFLFQERRHPEAIFPLGLFGNRVFVQANLLAVLQSAGMFGAIQYLPTFIQTSLGHSATSSGLVSTPQSLGTLVSSFIAGQLISRTGRFKYPVVFGTCLILVATLLLQTLDVGMDAWHISLFMAMYGLGSGIVMPTVSVIVQSAVPFEFLGVATSGRQFFMQIGQVLGAAIFGVVVATSYSNAFSDNLTHGAELPAHAYQQFEDPTLGLDARALGQVRTEILALPNGQAIFDDAVASQKEGVATAIRHIFLGSSVVALVTVLLAATMKEIPLRRTFGNATAVPQAAAGRSPEPARPLLEEAPQVIHDL